MNEPRRAASNWRKSSRIRASFLAAGLLTIASCQGFPGTVSNSSTGILGDDVLSAVVKGMPPAEVNQLKQHRLALQIKKAGGDVTMNMALYPASTIVGVDLHQTHIVDADILQLKAFPNLRTLNLYSTRITDAGLQNVAALRGLQILHLGGTQITDAGLFSLLALTDLHELGLTHTKVTDEGMTTLASLKGLSELTLSGVLITDKGLAQLKSLSHLRKLVLIKTQVTKAGVAQLQRDLPDVHIYFT